uniref:Uncharacterized protein n=1 Tax=Solanum lycopersicum TaxID=4081 RepID=A0A3Q7EK83_SOLLC
MLPNIEVGNCVMKLQLLWQVAIFMNAGIWTGFVRWLMGSTRNGLEIQIVPRGLLEKDSVMTPLSLLCAPAGEET